MDDDSTIHLQHLIDRMNAGDPTARAELIGHARARLLRLTRKMFKDFPRVHRYEETDDVLQNALVRLDKALRESPLPPTVAAFFRLATLQIRRELLDLTRHYFGKEGEGAHHASWSGGDGSHPPAVDRPDSSSEPSRLAGWAEFHERVAALPHEEREVFELLWYQELTQAQAGQVLGVSVPTIKRRWVAARMLLSEFLQDSDAK